MILTHPAYPRPRQRSSVGARGPRDRTPASNTRARRPQLLCSRYAQSGPSPRRPAGHRVRPASRARLDTRPGSRPARRGLDVQRYLEFVLVEDDVYLPTIARLQRCNYGDGFAGLRDAPAVFISGEGRLPCCTDRDNHATDSLGARGCDQCHIRVRIPACPIWTRGLRAY